MSMGRNQYGVTDEDIKGVMEQLSIERARPDALSPEERKREQEADAKRREEAQHEHEKRARARREKNKEARIAQELKIAVFVEGCGPRVDTLKGMGFRDYDDYRKSWLWRKITKRIRKRDEDRCFRCRGDAGGAGGPVHVHHRSYAPKVLAGLADECLVCLCEGCHNIIHFDDHRRPRTDQETERLLLQRDTRSDFPEPKVDLRRGFQDHPPGWERMTAVQRVAHNERRFEVWAEKKALLELAKRRQNRGRMSEKELALTLWRAGMHRQLEHMDQQVRDWLKERIGDG
jgi:hypothetical protein